MSTLNAKKLGIMLSSVSIYREVLKDEVFESITKIVTNQHENENQAIEIYSNMFHLLCNSKWGGNLCDYVYDKIIYSENLFTLECAKGNFEKIPTYIIDAVKNDLSVFYTIANLTPDELKLFITNKYENTKEFTDLLPNFSNTPTTFADFGDFGDNISHFADYCKNNGYGFYGRYNFFYLDGRDITIKPVLNPDDVTLDNLKCYEAQRNTIKDNAKALLKGVKANNMLLYGQRGTGKSSTVKAIVNEYHSSGLRLIEVSKENLKHLGHVIDVLANIPMKFIVFVDDLTFTDGDDSYTALKAVLEGSSNKLGDNMALFATTNRRHMITETFMARQGDEVHLKDTLDESASLSDRFGITVTFSFPSRIEYIEIVNNLAIDNNIKLDTQKLEEGAIAWSARRGNFSPRTAKQYIDYVIASEIR